MNDYIGRFRRSNKGGVFVAIDAANLERSVQDMWVNPKDIVEPLQKHSSSDLRYRVDYRNQRRLTGKRILMLRSLLTLYFGCHPLKLLFYFPATAILSTLLIFCEVKVK
jgi:hypothetical protein